MAAGSEYSLYIKTDGTLWAMGRNQYGQLGDGTTTDRNSSVEIDSNVSAVVAGAEHSLYIKTNGTLWAMGRNQYGQLGDGTTTDRNSAVEIASDVSVVSAGTEHTLFIKTNQSLWAMGRNQYGQLNDGSISDRNSPVAAKAFYLDLQNADGGAVQGSGYYSSSSIATLYAVPQSDYFFGGWTGDIENSQNPTTVTMDGAKTITASFTNLETYASGREATARDEGNARIAYVQANPSTYNLYTEAEKNASDATQYASGRALGVNEGMRVGLRMYKRILRLQFVHRSREERLGCHSVCKWSCIGSE